MWRVGIAAVLAATMIVVRPAEAAPPSPTVSAPDAIAIDGWTGAVLYAKNPNALHDPASTVKIMTALVVLDRHTPLSRVVTVGWDAVSYGGSTAGLYAGERMTVWNLLHGMLMPSGNDAAIALADAVAGSPARFVSMMNAEAVHLHLWRTHFLTPNGFDAVGQVSTAHDLAFLARAAMQNAAFGRVVRTRFWHAWSADHSVLHSWQNLNRLLWSSRAINGIKTGTTPGAGACLVSSARKNGKWVIAVNLGSTERARFSDGTTLLNYALSVEAGPPSA